MTKYFFDLNYTLANEDTTYEYEVAKKLKVKKILTIGGSGARSLPFLALDELKELYISDISEAQHALIKLKLTSIKKLERTECMAFWTTHQKSLRDELLEKMNPPKELREFYQFFNTKDSDIPILYWGKWERTFRTFSKLVKFFFSEKVRRGVFEAQDSYAFYQKHINNFRWKLILALVGNKAIFNSLLYKGDFVKKNIQKTYFDFYSEAFERLFKLEIKKSHFLQLCFFGEVIYHEGLPIEFREDIFEKIKSSDIQISFSKDPIFSHKFDVDFISLSDVPSYLKEDMEKNYLNYLASSQPLYIAERYYLRRPEVDTGQYQDISDEFKNLAKEELVQMYEIKLWKLER